eukprot:scaffold33028_cov32-Tisochrysis_lutea.AAC.4
MKRTHCGSVDQGNDDSASVIHPKRPALKRVTTRNKGPRPSPPLFPTWCATWPWNGRVHA